MDNILVIFARKPELGKVKSRLAKSLGDENTLRIYKKLLKKTLDTAHKTTAILKTYWSSQKNTQIEYLQKGTDLGERMFNALCIEISSSSYVCLLGTDTPQLTSDTIEEAFRLLDKNDIVFGPSLDGGYYLVALKNNVPEKLFLNKSWSHAHVLKEALVTCQTLQLKVALLPKLMDIDTIEDYESWLSSNE